MRKWTLTAAVLAAATSIVAPSPAQAAATGRYVVTLQHQGQVSTLSAAPGRVLHRFAGYPGFTAEMTAAEARRLATDPAVRFVEPDRVLRLTGAQKNPAWGLDRSDQRGRSLSKSYQPSADGDTVHAYVIDTGIRTSHQQFGGRASYGYDFVGRDSRADDCNGHGTHVAGTIGGSTYGVAKKVKLVSVRVLDCEGSGSLSDVIDGIDWVTAHAVHPAVANMSLGGDWSPALDSAVTRAITSGVTFVAAAGNENSDASLGSPSGVPEAITVAASDRKDKRAPFSNWGRAVDLFAPGVDITSATAAGNTATATWSGTSMAAPHVAGAAALLLDASPGLTPAQVRNQLVANATKGKVSSRAGAPDRLLFVPAPPKAPAITTSRTATATVGVPYSAKLSLGSSRRGGWKLAAGALPAGLKLSAGGVLSGTPTVPGDRTVTVRFTDYVPQSVTRRVVIPVVTAAPRIVETSLADAPAGSHYTERLTVADGRDGVWSVESGTLPATVVLDPATGTLEGTVDEEVGALFTFTVRFTDEFGGTATRTYTLAVV
ncbi:putative subtilase-family protease [Actinoplanes missouriensis 431]|uniref:Putative subtilase-family protease n=1 Tax=Actinoplanes missouriensis (strain ATCC 14538 / DSM 43046 / CBS 188.64 / JCM 3121 / NBRC 102363 / NCIMB 12654 / NRRL B-3342 / UNCC 431) TaxID=512565 RepID=I0HFI6_ACTM4|nr:S8 family serine peptidase [Actinoplanes missouriensis]BAL91773.1 putative subtilase-family protease [Actinoplanes missouriensis 431]